LVINMTGAPDNITWEFWQPELTTNGDVGILETCHNIYIDENGIAYLAGCNLNGGGNLLIDVATTPGTPVFLGATEPRYSHDAFARGDTLWSSDILNGFFSVIDVRDKSNPVTLSTQNTTMNFTHNAWLSDDGKYLFTTDERENAYVDAYDITDLADIKLLDSYLPADTKGLGAIPHNTHYFDGYLVTSWYTDGVKIIDASRPDNLIEVGSYDTYLGPDGGFSGCWGVTPFLPSGLVIASDINSGLYVFQSNYTRACFLEGNVKAANTGMNLNNVSVVIESSLINDEESDIFGNYKTGQVTPGTFNVTFTKDGYVDKTVEAVLVNGEVTVLDVELNSLPNAQVAGSTLRTADNMPIEGAKVLLRNETFEFEVESNADGTFIIDGVFFGEYTVFAGAWGYQNIEFGELNVNEDGTYEILLEEGYQDDFIVDLNWEVTGNAETGAWERVEPVGTSFNNGPSNTNVDVEGDIGDLCYITGNGGGGAGNDDVDDGNTILTSPVMDLTTYMSPIINYNLWFFNAGGSGNPNDFLEVRISNGTEEVVVERLVLDNSSREWNETSEIVVSDFIDITDNMRMIVETADDDPGHLVESGIDAFLVIEGEPLSASFIENDVLKLNITPNPFDEIAVIEYELTNAKTASLNVFNVLGQQVETQVLELTSNQTTIGSNLDKGIYFIQLEVDGEVSRSMKIVKE